MGSDRKSEIWNKRNQNGGEPYKKYVLDPWLLKLAGDFCNKTVLDQGCGNGCLSVKIAKKNPKKLVLLDCYQGNLDYAQHNLKSAKCQLEFLKADLNKPLDLKTGSFDLVLSNMVLIEIKRVENLLKETNRILKIGGTFVFSVVHPAYALKKYLAESYYGQAQKITPGRSYFDDRKSHFIFGIDSHANSIIKAPHYNRTIEQYFVLLKTAGFVVDEIIEPKLTKKLLEEAPRFKSDEDCPVALIFRANKI